MTETEIPKEASLLRCVVKKSISLIEKIVLYAAYVIVAITGIVIAGFIAWKGFGAIIPVLSAIYGILVSIPWYGYVGIVAVLAIPVYPLLWCIARELTEEDWQSETAEFVAGAVAVAVAVALVVAGAVALVVAGAVALALAGALVVALALAGAVALVVAGANSNILQFPGAYLHYRERIKLQRSELK